MKRIILTMTEQEKYEIIKTLVEKNGNKSRAAIKLGCSNRTINRMIKGYKEKGKVFFVHGNHKHKPVSTINDTVRNAIIDLYKNKYYESNFTHFAELLESVENIKISRMTISNFLRELDIISPKAHRSTKRELKAILKNRQENTISKKEQEKIQTSILELDQAHPRLPRCCYFGELIQMDASQHRWFGNIKTHLHAAIDDATNTIVALYFDYEETLNGYYNVFYQILNNYGIPYSFFTDNRTVFEYKRQKDKSVEKDTFTQFGYACKQLGVELKTSSVPQAKGRIERLFGTLQSRLPVELRLAGVTTIDEANKFLNSYIKQFNAQFAINPNTITSVFDKQVDKEKINLTLSVINKRVFDNGAALSYDKNYYMPIDENGKKIHFKKGTEATVISSFNKQFFCCVDKNIYALELIPKHERFSKNFDLLEKEPLPRKVYIPAYNHPWRLDSVKKHFKLL